MKQASISKLPVGKFRFWVIFSWDMMDVGFLFDEEPKRDEELGGWKVDNAICDRVSAEMLVDMGMDLPLNDDASATSVFDHDFYYGEHSDGDGMHEPIEIELELHHIGETPLFPIIV